MSLEDDIALSQPYGEAVNDCASGAIGVVFGSVIKGMHDRGLNPEQIGDVFAALARIQIHMASTPEVARAEAAHDQLIQLAKDTFVQPPEDNHGPG